MLPREVDMVFVLRSIDFAFNMKDLFNGVYTSELIQEVIPKIARFLACSIEIFH